MSIILNFPPLKHVSVSLGLICSCNLTLKFVLYFKIHWQLTINKNKKKHSRAGMCNEVTSNRLGCHANSETCLPVTSETYMLSKLILYMLFMFYNMMLNLFIHPKSSNPMSASTVSLQRMHALQAYLGLTDIYTFSKVSTSPFLLSKSSRIFSMHSAPPPSKYSWN